jgi:hypothetical protein
MRKGRRNAALFVRKKRPQTFSKSGRMAFENVPWKRT